MIFWAFWPSGVPRLSTTSSRGCSITMLVSRRGRGCRYVERGYSVT
jgi:hypothetical protein